MRAARSTVTRNHRRAQRLMLFFFSHIIAASAACFDISSPSTSINSIAPAPDNAKEESRARINAIAPLSINSMADGNSARAANSAAALAASAMLSNCATIPPLSFGMGESFNVAWVIIPKVPSEPRSRRHKVAADGNPFLRRRRLRLLLRRRREAN